MAVADDTLELRYVGARFAGGRIPLDVLPDLSIFRDLVIAIAKSRWLREHPGRQRLPRGFNHSVSFDLIDIKEGSAGPQLQWNRGSALENAPDLAEEIGGLVQIAFSDAAHLFHGAANDRYPSALPADQLAALNKFGASLLPGERIEFVDQKDIDGNVIYLDTDRRKRLLTRVGETYTKKFSGTGTLVTSSSEGYIVVSTVEYGKITIVVPADIVVEHYDGNLGSDVQFDLEIVLDGNDQLRRIERCLDVTIVEASDAPEFRDAMARIVELRLLGKGWLDGDGEPIRQSVIKLARSLLHRRPDITQARLGIFPTEEGGLTIEFCKSGWEYAIELLPDGGVQTYGTELDGVRTSPTATFDELSDLFWAEIESKIGRFEKDGQ